MPLSFTGLSGLLVLPDGFLVMLYCCLIACIFLRFFCQIVDVVAFAHFYTLLYLSIGFCVLFLCLCLCPSYSTVVYC